MTDIPIAAANCVRLTNNEITLNSAVPLARRFAKDGCWQIDLLDRGPLASLLAYACDPHGPDANACAKIVHDAAGLIAREDHNVRAALTALRLTAAVGRAETQLAYRLVRAGVPGSELATAVWCGKLGLGPARAFCERLTLCDRGVVLGQGTVIAPLMKLASGRLGLKVEGGEDEILALLCVARGGPAPPHAIERLHNVSKALQQGDRALAEVGLACIGVPSLSHRGAAEALTKAASEIQAGGGPREFIRSLAGHSSANKASPDDPKHPGWPAGAPNSQGGRFRPKTPDDYPDGPSKENQGSPGRMNRVRAVAISLAIHSLLAEAESTPNPYVTVIALLAELSLDVYPYVKAYFDPANPLEELQASARFPSQAGYEDHHIVEQATANPDGSENAQMAADDNLVRIPTVKHWRLNQWYETSNYELNGETPRKFLKGKAGMNASGSA